MANIFAKTHPVVWLRRLVQTFFLFLFFDLLLETTFHPIDKVGGPVTFFFELDPLVMISTFIAAHTVPAALLLSLIVMGVTLLFGRWFCGWACPFGALHNFFTSLRDWKRKDRILHGGYTRWNKAKYYVLIAFLTGGILGVNAVGWLDPFSFFYRSFSTSILPAINHGLTGFFTWAYETDPGVGSARLTSVTEPVYSVLRERFLDPEPYFYQGGFLIGVLFIAIVALNLFRVRFWCRYICPLGALLGVTGKNPIVRVQKDEDHCNGCNLCAADCQGGANPHVTGGWKPTECFYCYNCVSACPSNSIRIVSNDKEEKR
ncbi:MAG: 4Fe-4S binding protein [bacterium]|nr:4Fe-4S binding protein [bacterium]